MSNKKQVEHKKIKITTIAVLLASITLLVLATLYASVTFWNFGKIKSESELEDPLEAWSEASYIIWKYNSTYTALRNCSTLEVECFSTNTTLVFQTGYDLLPSGGMLFVKAGEYVFSVAVNPCSNSRLVGEGIDITILTYTGPGVFLNIEDKTNVYISDLTIRRG